MINLHSRITAVNFWVHFLLAYLSSIYKCPFVFEKHDIKLEFWKFSFLFPLLLQTLYHYILRNDYQWLCDMTVSWLRQNLFFALDLDCFQFFFIIISRKIFVRKPVLFICFLPFGIFIFFPIDFPKPLYVLKASIFRHIYEKYISWCVF